MTYMTILEKMQILINNILNHKMVLVLAIALFIFTLFYIIKVINKKQYVLSMIMSFVMILGFTIGDNYSVLSNTFDKFMTTIFENVYFPSIYVYIASILIIFISLIISILNIKIKNIYRIINGIAFIFNGILLVLVLSIVSSSEIDVFSISSLYTDKNLLAILEISIVSFILWIVSLCVVYITNCLYIRFTKEKKVLPVVENELVLTNEEINNLNTDKIDVNLDNTVVPELVLVEDKPVEYIDVRKIPVKYDTVSIVENAVATNTTSSVTNNATNTTSSVTNNATNNNQGFSYIFSDYSSEVFNEIDNRLNGLSEVINQGIVDTKDNASMNDMVDAANKIEYTIDDYKKFVLMLEEIKAKSSKSNLSIDDAMMLNLVNNYSLDDCIRFREILKNNLN